jgi:gliding motility-associated-like protein
MCKYRLLSLLICLGASRLLSQITATAGTVNACGSNLGALVTFSAPAGATASSWTLEPGKAPASLHVGQHLFPTGTHVTTYAGTVGGAQVTFTTLVVVHPPPTVDFTIIQPSSPCTVKNVTITDQSTANSPITTWLWAFGDGGSSTSSGTQMYPYTVEGSFSVTLKVADSYGCVNQVTKGPVSVTLSPNAVIASNPTPLYSCTNTFSAQLTGTVSSGNNLSYSWNFGNGQTSTSPNPVVTYTGQQNPYLLTLTVSSGPCISIKSVPVTVRQPTLSVTFPATVCPNTTITANVLSNQPFATWNLGSGANPTVILTPSPSNPTIALPAYSVTGIYTITIDGSSAQCTMAPVTKTVLVEKVTADFSGSTPSTTCHRTFSPTYSSTSSSNAVQFQWSYYDQGGTLITNANQNPTLNFVYNAPPDPYTHDSIGFNPTVTLVAISAAGCRDTMYKILHHLLPPTAWLVKSIQQGCAPLTVTLMNKSYSFTQHPITSYTWVSNNMNPSITVVGSGSVIMPQTFVYSPAGTYSPYLMVSTGPGANTCTDVSFYEQVIVEDPPVFTFNVAPPIVCWDQPVVVTTVANPGAVDHWHVQSNNGYFSHCITDPAPSWFFTQTGVHTFTMSGYKNGCQSTVAATQSVQVRGPIVRARYITTCDANRMTVNFIVSLQEVTSLTVNYDDGGPPVTINPGVQSTLALVHTYDDPGDYSVSFSATGSNCGPNTHVLPVTVRDLKADFVMPTDFCANVSYTFDATPSEDELVGCGRGYAWYFDNEPPHQTAQNPTSHAFGTGGTHTVTLLVKDVNSCTTTETKTITVSDANPQFSLGNSSICLSSGTVLITNNTPQIPDPIISYTWNFGDGQILPTTQNNAQIKTYTSANVPFSTYTISLTAINDKGCVRTTTQEITVFKPAVDFTAVPRVLCLAPNTQSAVTFTALNTFVSYTYNFGVGSNPVLTTTEFTAGYSFPVGVHIVSLQATDARGCIAGDTLYINAVTVPKADFLVSTPNATAAANVICLPGIATFENISEPKPTIASWDVGVGNVKQSDKILIDYSHIKTTTVIPVSLTVTTGPPNFCQASVTKNFTLYVIQADPVLTRTMICLGNEIGFSLDTSKGGGLKEWQWDYGDFTPTETWFAGSAPPVVSHTYTNFDPLAAGNISVSLIYYNSDKSCTYTKQRAIQIIRVEANFLRNADSTLLDTMHCIGIPDIFTNTSKSNDGFPVDIQWKFPDGRNSADPIVNHTFSLSGVHAITLTAVNGARGCTNTAVKNMTIAAPPTVTILPDEYCPDVPFTVTLVTSPNVVSGTWTPVEKFLSPTSFSVFGDMHVSQAKTDSATVFSVQVTDRARCISDVVSANINILFPPAPESWDTAVVIGEHIPINAFVGQYLYDWQPPTPALSCTNCPYPVSTSTDNITYIVRIEDHKGCAAVYNQFRIDILPKSSLDVPTAFTPNGDGVNDVIYVDGWGLKKLIYFRIFNRWGQLVFETNDLTQGWDGRFDGVLQPVDTYVYQASGETYIDKEPITKSSTFKLLR